MKTIYIFLVLVISFAVIPKQNYAQIREAFNETINFLELQESGSSPSVLVSISLMETGAISSYGVHSASFLISKDSNYSNPAVQFQRNIKSVYFGSKGRFVQSAGSCNNADSYFRFMLYKSTTGVMGQIITYTPSGISGDNGYNINIYRLTNDLLINFSSTRDFGNSVIGKNYIISGFISTTSGARLFLSMKIVQFLMGPEGPL